MQMPSQCPVCSAYSLAPDREVTALVAVCDVLVYKALEALGKYIVRAERSRFAVLGTKPFHEAHTIWSTDDQTVDKACRWAWDVVPALLNVYGPSGRVAAEDVTSTLDSYVHDLAITGTPHSIEELNYRLSTKLGVGETSHG